jgi:hypothetical protein
MLLLISCSSAPLLSSDQQAYLSKAQSFPTDFSVPKDSDSQVWERAKLFAATYPSKTVRILSDSMIESEPVTMVDMSAYRFQRSRSADSIRFDVSSIVTKYAKLGAVGTDRTASDLDAHLAAYYLATGEIYPELLKCAR